MFEFLILNITFKKNIFDSLASFDLLFLSPLLVFDPHKKQMTRGKNILEQLSRTRFFTWFENPALFFPAT